MSNDVRQRVEDCVRELADLVRAWDRGGAGPQFAAGVLIAFTAKVCLRALLSPEEVVEDFRNSLARPEAPFVSAALDDYYHQVEVEGVEVEGVEVEGSVEP